MVDSEEYKNIAQQELDDLMTSIQDEFFYNTSIMKIIEEKSKKSLNINFPISSILNVADDKERNICSADNLLLTNKYFTTPYYKIPINSIEDVSVNRDNRSKLKIILGISVILLGAFIWLIFLDSIISFILEPSYESFIIEFAGNLPFLLSIVLLVIGAFLLKKSKKMTLAIQIKNKVINTISDTNKKAINGFYDGIQKAKSL